MDELFKTQFMEQSDEHKPKSSLWPLFHKALYRCRIINRQGIAVDRSVFFWFNTNERLRSLLDGTDAHYTVRELNKQEFDALWLPR